MNTNGQYQYNPYSGGQRPRRGIGAGAVVAIALCCLLIGGAIAYMIASSAVGRQNAAELPYASPAITEQAGSTPAPTSGRTADSGKHFSLESAATLPSTGDRQALSIIEIAEKVGPSVVYINTETTQQGGYWYSGGTIEGAGSGILISSDGYILTNCHVVNGADSVVVGFEDGKEYPAEVVGQDEVSDVAIVKIDLTGENRTPATLGDSTTLQVGELAVSIGNPLTLSGTVTAGIISSLSRSITLDDGNTLTVLQTDAAINAGSSGGALINSFGEVIGINVAKTAATGVEGICYAIPISNVKGIIEDLINIGYIDRPYIGIGIATVTESVSRAYGLPVGVYVTGVMAGGPADLGGLKTGDVIIAFNGVTVKTTDELDIEKFKCSVGDTAVLTVIRNNQQMEVSIKLGSQKDIEALQSQQGQREQQGQGRR